MKTFKNDTIVIGIIFCVGIMLALSVFDSPVYSSDQTIAPGQPTTQTPTVTYSPSPQQSPTQSPAPNQMMSPPTMVPPSALTPATPPPAPTTPTTITPPTTVPTTPTTITPTTPTTPTTPMYQMPTPIQDEPIGTTGSGTLGDPYVQVSYEGTMKYVKTWYDEHLDTWPTPDTRNVTDRSGMQTRIEYWNFTNSAWDAYYESKSASFTINITHPISDPDYVNILHNSFGEFWDVSSGAWHTMDNSWSRKITEYLTIAGMKRIILNEDVNWQGVESDATKEGSKTEKQYDSTTGAIIHELQKTWVGDNIYKKEYKDQHDVPDGFGGICDKVTSDFTTSDRQGHMKEKYHYSDEVKWFNNDRTTNRIVDKQTQLRHLGPTAPIEEVSYRSTQNYIATPAGIIVQGYIYLSVRTYENGDSSADTASVHTQDGTPIEADKWLDPPGISSVVQNTFHWDKVTTPNPTNVQLQEINELIGWIQGGIPGNPISFD